MFAGNIFGVIVSAGIVMIFVLLILKSLAFTKKSGIKPSLSIFNRASYRSTNYLCTKAEQNFLSQLLNKLPLELVYVSAKVRLADLALPINSKDIGSFNKVARKHVDFVICSRTDSKILACIELDDSSHASRSAQKRDGEKNKALSDAGIPLFRVTASRGYSQKIQQIVRFLNLEPMKNTSTVKRSNEIKKSPVKKVEEQKIPRTNKVVKKDMSACPRCNSGMEKIEMKWPNRGFSFQTCTVCSFRTEPEK
ncbi:DUF2726 domain-containing protein [Vibrio sp. 10N]|uniref:DUF2726 domain-containing protein n=1 Tax=Vibrio sp. 10N TaxID=3058938 RepID=UPI002812F3AB|nr:hypothetical protein VB10N_46560 [Vibrio sp. 10N]